MIRLDHIAFGYRPRRLILRDVSFAVPDGARVCLTGPSGCGKSTVLRLILGLEKPKSGTLTVPEGTRFSAVFQENRLLPGRTALQNVALFSDTDTAAALLNRLGLTEALHRLPDELSGGMKRRVALARALAHPFDVLILDEPLTGLDEESIDTCLAVIGEVLGDRTLIAVSHQPELMQALHGTAIPLTMQKDPKPAD